jgi:hypothetical protein
MCDVCVCEGLWLPNRVPSGDVASNAGGGGESLKSPSPICLWRQPSHARVLITEVRVRCLVIVAQRFTIYAAASPREPPGEHHGEEIAVC